ncbi:MAG TPA: M23 family metallopeptidase [Candidatus Polarisedimenticolaceae bacterium]|nr:M23 family metallopeptidase [Candidatus Polarisedimenticolaceae bacterium]
MIRLPRRRLVQLAWLSSWVLFAWLLVAMSAPGRVPSDPTTAVVPPSIAGPPAPTAPAEPLLRSLETTVGRRGTLAASLDRLDVPVEHRQRLVELASESLELKRLDPRTGLLARIDGEGRWHSLSIRDEPERFLRIEIGGAAGAPAYEARRVELPVTTDVRTLSGVIDRSVAQAVAGSPHAVPLVAAFADIFQWDVDLLVEPRKGDRVKIVYELRTLGDPPDDLPEFAGTPREPGEVLAVSRILAASYLGEVAQTHAFWVEGPDGAGDYYDVDGRPLRKTFLKSPLNYRRISSGFSRARRHPVTRKIVPHHGIDYAAAPGTPVVAAADGRVVSAGWDGALGKAVRIRHGSEYLTVYGHLRAFARGVRRGAEIRQNEVVGYVGSTGRATGPHLHYTMIHRGRPVDPRRIDNPAGEPLDASRFVELELAVRRFANGIDLDAASLASAARLRTDGASGFVR